MNCKYLEAPVATNTKETFTNLSICIGGQLAKPNANRGALRLFLALELFLRECRNDFFNMLGTRLLVRLVTSTAVAAMNAPPPTSAPQASPKDTLIDEFRFFREDGGVSVR